MDFKQLNNLLKWKEIPSFVQPFEILIKNGFNHFDPIEFEGFVLKLFEAFGFNGSLTPMTNDGGIDIIFRGVEEIVVVQCKRYNTDSSVSVHEVRELFGAMSHYKANYGYFIATTQFSDSAKSFAEEHDNLLLIGPRALERLFRLSVISASGKL